MVKKEAIVLMKVLIIKQIEINPYLHSVEIDGMIQAPYSGGAKAHGQEQKSPIQKEDAMGWARHIDTDSALPFRTI